MSREAPGVFSLMIRWPDSDSMAKKQRCGVKDRPSRPAEQRKQASKQASKRIHKRPPSAQASKPIYCSVHAPAAPVTMSAWGKGSSLRSCDSLLERVEKNDPNFQTLVLLPLKNFTSDDCLRLASAIRGNGAEGHLRSIHASGHAVSVEALEALGAAVACSGGKITSLAIGDSQMGDEGITALCRGLSCECATPSEGSSSPSAPAPAPALQVLDLSYKGASKGAMKALGECLSAKRYSSLISLDLSRNEGIGENSGIEVLSQAFDLARGGVAFRHLRTLNLAQCNIGPDDASKLASFLLANVKEADKPIDEDDTDTSVHVPVGSRSRFELILNANPIESTGCIFIGSLLSRQGISFLSSLSLVDCNIGDDGVSALVDTAKSGGCSGLVTLDLSSNQITKVGAGKLSTALATEDGTALMSSLRELRLSDNDIGGEGITSICRNLVQVPQWKRIDDDKMGSNSTLSILELCKTNCGADGFAATVKCGALTKLRLFGNRMGSAGFLAAAPLLRGGHPALVELDIGGNDAKEDAVENLLREISATDIDNAFDSTLRILEIGGNEVGENVELALKHLKVVRPELDVARDKPKSNEPWAESEQDANIGM